MLLFHLRAEQKNLTSQPASCNRIAEKTLTGVHATTMITAELPTTTEQKPRSL